MRLLRKLFLYFGYKEPNLYIKGFIVLRKLPYSITERQNMKHEKNNIEKQGIFNGILSAFRNTIHNLKTVWISAPLYFLVIIFISIINVIIPLICAHLMKRFVYVVEGNVVEYFTSPVIYLVSVAILIIVFKLILEFLGERISIISFSMTQKIDDEMYQRIAKKMRLIPFKNFEDPAFNDNMSKASRYSPEIQKKEIILLISAATSILNLFVIAVLVAEYSIWIVVLTIIACIFKALINWHFEVQKIHFDNENIRLKRKVDYFEGALRDPKVIREYRVYNKIEFIQNIYKSYIDEYSYKIRKNAAYELRVKCGIAVVEKLFYVLNLFLIVNLVIHAQYDVSDYVYLTTILATFTQAANSFFDVIPQGTSSNEITACFKKIIDMEERDNKSRDIEDNVLQIEFKNVSFIYPNTKRKILNNLSFIINTEEMTALVGRNGAGKSTIIKLILGLYEPTEGEILINGINIQSVDYERLMRKFSVIFQDYAQYALTVREQVYLGNTYDPIDDNLIDESVRQAGVNSFVEEFPNGVNQELTKKFTKNGVELSGGQWQRLSLAKTFYKNADILILDEPAASLDPYIETALFNSIESMKNTRIVISHRLTNVVKCEKIIVIEDGKLVGQGTHKELLYNCPCYATLYAMQVENYNI